MPTPPCHFRCKLYALQSAQPTYFLPLIGSKSKVLFLAALNAAAYPV